MPRKQKEQPKDAPKQAQIEVYSPDQPTPQQLAAVEALSAHGFSAADIGIYLERPEAWVQEKFGDVMNRSRIRFNVKLVQTITEVAFGRERQTRPVMKTRTNAKGKTVEYEGMEVVREGRPPNVQMLLYLAKDRLGWAGPANNNPLGVPLTENLRYDLLDNAELDQLGRLLQKIGYQPTASESS